MGERAVTDGFIEREQILLTSQDDKLAFFARDTFEAPELRFTDSLGGHPYCFRLSIRDDDARAKYGANAALATYKPWHSALHPSEFSSECIALKETLKTRWNRKTGSKEARATHAMLNQGSLHVPDKDHAAFIKTYTRALQAGLKMYIAEQPSAVTKMYMDLDFNQLKGLSERGIEAVAVVCAKTVAKFFPSHQSVTIVAAGPHKKSSLKRLDGPEVTTVKTGVHLHWPSFLVTGPQAREIRLNVIDALIEAFGHRSMAEFRNPWTEVVDDSIYCKSALKGGSGLRMLGSWKAKSCKACSRSAGDCHTCHGFKHVVESDIHGAPGCPYMMLCVLGAGSTERDIAKETYYMDHMEDLILDASIRTPMDPEDIPDMYERPSGAATIDAEPDKARKSKRPLAAARNERSVDASDPVYNELQAIIREAFGPLYASVVVRSVSRSQQQYTVTVGGANCRYCQNIGTEHRSNNIFFVVRQDGVVQRCYDSGPLDARMLHGPCSSYQSSAMPISVKSIATLWASAKDTMSALTANPTAPVGDPDELLESASMKALLKLGDFLAEALYGTLWTPHLGLSKGQSGQFVPQDDRDLGTRGVQAYQDLGLSWASALLERTATSAAEWTGHDESKSLKHATAAVLEAFDTIVWVAANESDPAVFEGTVYVDDLLKLCANGRSFQDMKDLVAVDEPKGSTSDDLVVFTDDET